MRPQHRKPSLVIVIKGEDKTPDAVSIIPFEDWEILEVVIEHKSGASSCTVISDVAGYK